MPPERLSIAVHSGSFVRVHYALVMASGALAVNRPVTLFFTGESLPALLPDGWRQLPGAERDAQWQERGVVGFAELFAACIELGARVIVCEMALRAAGIAATALRSDMAIEVAGVVTFLGEDGRIVFV